MDSFIFTPNRLLALEMMGVLAAIMIVQWLLGHDNDSTPFGALLAGVVAAFAGPLLLSNLLGLPREPAALFDKLFPDSDLQAGTLKLAGIGIRSLFAVAGMLVWITGSRLIRDR